MTNVFKFLLISLFSITLSAQTSIFDLELTGVKGKKYKMEDFKGKLILAVNTASACGYTGQLGSLQKLHEKYSVQGLQVIGFPSNEFNQESMEGEEIGKFCSLKYGVKFPLMKKGDLNGEKAQAFYKELFSKAPLKGQSIAWNFEKILISKKGDVVKKYKSSVAPMGSDLEDEIKKQLEL